VENGGTEDAPQGDGPSLKRVRICNFCLWRARPGIRRPWTCSCSHTYMQYSDLQIHLLWSYYSCTCSTKFTAVVLEYAIVRSKIILSLHCHRFVEPAEATAWPQASLGWPRAGLRCPASTRPSARPGAMAWPGVAWRGLRPAWPEATR
jgi:hypothetical protein